MPLAAQPRYGKRKTGASHGGIPGEVGFAVPRYADQ